MAQFDVYKNSNATTKAAYPYFVDVQSNILSEISSRIVIPLGTLTNFKKQQLENLTPVITYNDEELLLLTPQIASIPLKSFSKPIGSIAHLHSTILASVDFALSGF
jgi:toxin CcdB